jgi:hypothetical protein
VVCSGQPRRQQTDRRPANAEPTRNTTVSGDAVT